MNLIIGASHALFMAQALGRFEADWDQASRGAIDIDDTGCDDPWQVLFLTPKTQYITFNPGPAGVQAVADPMLLGELARHDTADARVVCLIGGNEHNSQFMLAQPRPFDLHHPRVPGFVDGRQIVPRSALQAALAASVGATRLTLRLLAGVVPRARRCIVAPPPPIPSAAQIMSNPEAFRFGAAGVELPRVRLKIYETMLDVMAGVAAESGFAFIAPPAECRDAEGFLREEFWLASTHAKPAYYLPVLAQLGVVRESVAA